MNLVIILNNDKYVNLKEFSKYCDGHDMDLQTGEERVFYYDLPQHVYEKLVLLAQQHGLKLNQL